MKLYAVRYVYGGPAEILAEHRPAHRAFLRNLADQGTLLASGPFTDDDAPGALLLVRGADAEQVRRILAEDPLQVHGVVTEHSEREWNVTIGTVGPN